MRYPTPPSKWRRDKPRRYSQRFEGPQMLGYYRTTAEIELALYMPEYIRVYASIPAACEANLAELFDQHELVMALADLADEMAFLELRAASVPY